MVPVLPRKVDLLMGTSLLPSAAINRLAQPASAKCYASCVIRAGRYPNPFLG